MFSVKVREVAEAKGFKTPGRLARESRVSYATVHRLWNEPDKSEEGLTLGVIFRLAQTLRVSIGDLVEASPGNMELASLTA